MANILVVDDEPDMLHLMCELLRRSTKHAVHSAASPAEAVDLARIHRPDLLVTDFQMPGKNGTELARELKASLPELRTILVSAFADSSLGEKAKRDGTIDASRHKPVEPADFIVLVKSFVG